MLHISVEHIYGTQKTPRLESFSDNIDACVLLMKLDDALRTARLCGCSSVRIFASVTNQSDFEPVTVFNQKFVLKNGNSKKTR